VILDYPPAQVHEDVGDPPHDESADLTWRPHHAEQGRVTFRVNGRSVTVGPDDAGRFVPPAAPGDRVTLARHAGRDQYGNVNRNAVVVQP
jgi:hypothetical protein